MQINTTRLRAILGWLAILLPIIVSILALAYGFLGDHIIPASISETYYLEPCITPFMIILGAASILLICYKGYDKQDDIICTLAGVFGLCICLFPTDIADPNITNVGTFMIPKHISSIIHDITAVVFFALLAYNSLFLFTKGDGNPTPNKKKRNIIYIVCGVGMIVSFAILLLPKFYIQMWLVEAIALFFFGLSFLTKADIYPWLFCDTPYKD